MGVSPGEGVPTHCSPGCKSLMGSLRGEEQGDGNGSGMLPWGRACTGSFILSIFLSFLQVETLEEL